jgi:hypothetical protein
VSQRDRREAETVSEPERQKGSSDSQRARETEGEQRQSVSQRDSREAETVSEQEKQTAKRRQRHFGGETEQRRIDRWRG